MIPGGQWAAAGFNAAYARANGGSIGEIAFSFGIGYIGGQLGQKAAVGAGFKVSSQGALATVGGQAFASAVSGAFTGAINAVVTDTKLSRGILRGAATGAAIGAIIHAVKGSPEQEVVRVDKGNQQNRQILLAANADSIEELDAVLGEGWELVTDAAGEQEQREAIGRSLTDPFVKGFDSNDPNFHDYNVGPSFACFSGDGGCSLSTVSAATNAQSVPFALLPPSEGRHNILGVQPIRHFSIGNISVNATLKGHWFHPGRVVYATFEHSGAVWVYTRGVGVGPNPTANTAIGRALFGKMHIDVQSQFQIPFQ